jgi:hypothetical protein
MEVCDSANPFGARSQEGGSEMKCSVPLAKAGTRDSTHSRRVKKLDAIELVGSPTISFGGFHGLGWDGDAWEKVHCTLAEVRQMLDKKKRGAPES